MVRKANGRKKIEMVKMTNETNLQVTFSKRRCGVFKKASELCTLCGAQVALIVFSPAGKVYSFGNPNVEVLLNRFLGRIPRHINSTDFVGTNTNSHLPNLNEMLTQVLEATETEKEKKRKAKLLEKERNKKAENWWKNTPEKLNLSQSIQVKQVVEDLKKKVDALYSQFHQNYHVGSSSNNGGNIHTDHNLFDQDIMMGINAYDPNMSQIQKQEELKQGHGPRH